ncbi:MAG: MFS transporter, partial [Candidatus Poribacteria bacterium]
MSTRNSCRLSLRVTLLIVGSLTVMAGATVAPALPAIREHFSGAPGARLWAPLVLTTPALFIVLWGPVAGVIADRWGRKPLIVGSVLLYALAGASGYLAGSLPALLLGRAFLGVAVGGIMTGVLALTADYLHGSARASFMGVQGAAMALGGVVFVMTGGVLADIHWRAPFLVYLAAIPVLPLAMLTLVEPKRERAPSDEAESRPRLALSSILPIYVVAALLQVAFYVLPVQIPFLLQADMGVGPRGTGLAISAGALCAMVTGILYGRIIQRLSFQTLSALGLGVMGVGYVLVSRADEYWMVVAGLGISEGGFGLLMP